MSRNVVLDNAKAFIARHLWMRVLLVPVFIALFPVALLIAIAAFVFWPPYHWITEWSNNRPLDWPKP